MPFKLCKSEKKRLDELIVRVKEISDTVDELRLEVDAMRLSSIVDSNERLNERRSKRSETNTLDKFKRCLEKNLIPVFSINPTYGMRKKCQQMFSHFPTIISRSPNLSSNDNPIDQHFPSSYAKKADNRSLNHKISPTNYLDKNKAKRIEKNIKFPAEFCKNLTTDSEKLKSLSSNSSENSLMEHYEPYNSHCTYATCNSLKSSQKIEGPGQLRKKKATETASTSPIRVARPKKRFVNPETLKTQRSVTFVDRKKKIPLEKSSSMSSSLSSSNKSAHHHQDCRIIYAKPKTQFNIKRTINDAPSGAKKKKKKRSSSAQCSMDYEYPKKEFSHQKDVCTNTLSDNLSREKKSIKIKRFRKPRRKLATEEAQTSLNLDKYREECAGRRQYCSKAKRKSCFSAGSLSSLTSCSPKSISSFSLGSDELRECSMHRFYKREPIPKEERLEKERRETDNMKESVQVFSLREMAKKGEKEKKLKPQRNRKKRTYVISSDIPMAKSDETDQCNFYEEQENSSSIGDSIFEEKKLKRRPSRKKWKILEVAPKGHQLWKKQQLYPEKETRRKLEVGVCTDETCSLTSGPSLETSNESHQTVDRFNRKEEPTKEFSASVRK